MNKAIVIVVYLTSLTLLLGLGTWQVKRGQFKQQIEQRLQIEHKAPQFISTPKELEQIEPYQTVQMRGRWQNQRSFFLLNRFFEQQLGVEVLTPFVLDSGEKMIVNRGWVANASYTAIKFPPELDPITLTGSLYQPNKGVTIGESILPNQRWPKQTLYFNLAAISQALDAPISPWVLVLDAAQPASFKRIWQPISMPAAKHYGYAVQWFGLAITLLVFGIIWIKNRS